MNGREKTDVLIFSGQSNMQGSTGEKSEKPSVKNCCEYKYLTDSFEPLKDPVGEDIGDALRATAEGNGSLVPSFCEKYAENGKRVVAIHVARGNTSLSEWQKGTERFDAVADKIKNGLRKVAENYDIERIFFIWLQGESDALKGTSTGEYVRMLKNFKNDLKRQIPISRFCVIKQGYFAAYAEWDERPFAEKKRSDKEIMKAFDIAAREDKDFTVLTGICKRLSRKKKYLNPKEYGPHFNNLGMEKIGRKAASVLAKAYYS